MNALLIEAIRFIAGIILGSGILDRILARVKEWAGATFAEGTPVADQNAAKRHGVMQDLDQIGLQLSEAQKRVGVELAVQVMKRQQA